ncbi:MAG: aspartate-semialdehyde dehydrogenase [Marinobacterium sp.]|nr:aspartate-semialdehyde dehydrogenase [Marinobacterium sp.]
MSRKYNVAVVGATGLVGEAMIEILEQREFPVENLYPLASDNSAGKTIFFNEQSRKVELLDSFDFSQVDIALFAASDDVAMQYGPVAAREGAVVIDTSAAFMDEPDIPLVVADINPQQLVDYNLTNIVVCPGGASVPLLTALAPLHRQVGIHRLNITVCQSVSGNGRAGVEELAAQTAALLNTREPQTRVFSKQIAFNLHPLAGAVADNGATSTELQIIRATRALLGNEYLDMHVSCVQVPVFFGHSATVHIETDSPISAWEVRDLLLEIPDLDVIDEPDAGGFATPVTEAAGNDQLYVSRIRNGLDNENSIDMFIVADNVRKGAALNSVQIAELLIAHYL